MIAHFRERLGLSPRTERNHLADASGEVSPRSFLAAIGQAARVPAAGEHALHWNGIHEGVRRASEIRVDEIQEDLPWAHAAMVLLEDLSVPCPKEKVVDAWKKGYLFTKKLKGLPANAEEVMSHDHRQRCQGVISRAAPPRSRYRGT